MTSYTGILFSVIALVSWGFGDFFIQRSARKFGDWESVFIMSLVGALLLLPFAVSDISIILQLSLGEIGIVLLASLSFVVSALVSVEALKRGKLSVVSSMSIIEIPIAGVLAYAILQETASPLHWVFVAVVVVGIGFVTVRPHHFRRETWIERGAVLALASALVMSTVDFMIGFGSRVASPVLTIWIANVATVLVAFIYMSVTGRLAHFRKDFRLHARLMLGIGILDNVAWLSFAMATLFIPIVVAVVLSESYVILATILGVFINREKLRPYQMIGIGVALGGVLMLAQFY